jgi:hypothetical protein
MKLWEIIGLQAHQQMQDKVDVIYSLQYKISSLTSDVVLDNKEWVNIVFNVNSNFIPKPEVTNDVMVDWLKTNLGSEKVAQLESQLDKLIATKKTQIQQEITEKIANNVSLKEFFIIKTDLSGMDLSNLDLTGASFTYCNLTNVNFSNTNLTNVNLSESNLTGANLIGANLTNINITEAQGNQKEIVTWYKRQNNGSTKYHSTNFTKDILSIGCILHSIEEWKSIDQRYLKVELGNDYAVWNESEQDAYNVIEEHFKNSDIPIPIKFYSWGNGIYFYPDDGKSYLWDEQTEQWSS